MALTSTIPKRKHPTEGKREYITLAGSGPSAIGYGKVDVSTKKLTTDADCVAGRFISWWYKPRNKEKEFMAYKVMECPKYPIRDRNKFYQADYRYWDGYFLSFNPKNSNKKPSTGLCAFFCIVERWTPDTVGLIGFDWVIDGFRDWPHDSRTELACMKSLAKIIDLRTGKEL